MRIRSVCGLGGLRVCGRVLRRRSGGRGVCGGDPCARVGAWWDIVGGCFSGARIWELNDGNIIGQAILRRCLVRICEADLAEDDGNNNVHEHLLFLP